MSIIPNICSAISSVTLTRTRFNKAINQTLTRRGRPFGAEFGWLGSGADAAHGVGTAPRPLVTRGECPSPARQQRGQFPRGSGPGLTLIHRRVSSPARARQGKPVCLVAVTRGQRRNLLSAVCPVSAPAMPHACPEAAPRVGLQAPPPAAKALTAPSPRSKRKISL